MLLQSSTHYQAGTDMLLRAVLNMKHEVEDHLS